MNHHELVTEISESTGVSKKITDLVLKNLGDVIAAELVVQGSIHLHGIGTVSVVETKARSGRNPGTGEVIEIPAGRRVKLKAAKVLKDHLI